MSSVVLLLVGAVLGSTITCIVQSRGGKRRLAWIHDRGSRLSRQAERILERKEDRLADQASGLLSKLHSERSNERPSDQKLQARVRARLGRLVSHPHAVVAEANGGIVTLRGPLLEGESERLLNAVQTIAGVGSVKDELFVCRHPEHISALQGGRTRERKPRIILWSRWSAETSVLASLTGLLGLYYGITGDNEWGFGIAMTAALLLAKGLSDLFLGMEDAVFAFEHTLKIDAPLSDVFTFWSDPRNYPQVLSHIKRVTKDRHNLYHFTVIGPGGTSIGWDGKIIKSVPNTLLSWKSEEGSMVENEGTAFFDPVYDGTMRLHIRMSYRLPAGLAGKLFATALGDDPAKIMREDLQRLKRTMERGHTHAVSQC